MGKGINGIKEKIKKLLNITIENGATENEVRVALLKAQQYLAEYKLEVSDLEGKKEVHIIQKQTEFFFTGVTNPWIQSLMSTLADKYCCFWYVSYKTRERNKHVCLSGTREDVEILESVIKYCCDNVLSATRRYLREYYRSYDSAEYHKVENSIAEGFTRGLRDAYKEQEAHHEEWGLVLVVPEEAKLKLHGTLELDFKNFGRESQAINKGYEEGYNFGNTKRLYNNQIG